MRAITAPAPSAGAGPVVADDRAVPADQQRPELAVPAPADAAAHVALQRHADPVGGTPRAGERLAR